MTEFPTIVYKAPGKHGARFDWRGAPDQEVFDLLIVEGWSATLPEALEGKSDEVTAARSEMEREAEVLGVKFDGRTTDKKLAERIEEARQ